MSKSLYLVRHAKSDWSIPGRADFDRDLNSRGMMDAPQMGRKLYDMGVLPELIISSPAVRARKTAEFIAEQLKYETEKIDFKEDIYEASLRTMLSIINQFSNSYNNIMLFGHNPGFTYLAEYLTKENLEDIPTCGVVYIDFAVDGWNEISGGSGSMKWLISPKKDLN
jgi:phosphohistidine phosphatase